MSPGEVAIIKVGGSVLRNPTSYARIARLLHPEFLPRPTKVVVSAAYGITDALERLAASANPGDARALLDRQFTTTGISPYNSRETDFWRGLLEAKVGSRNRLLAWGEQESAAAVQDHLARSGLLVPVEELRSDDPPSPDSAIVPGFYVRDCSGHVRCFPRGGSDISAVLIAGQLHARSIRFWKDGGGIRSNGEVLAEVDGPALAKQLAGTIRPIHPAALLLASRKGIDLVLEDPFDEHESTRIRSTESVSLLPRDLPDAFGSEISFAGEMHPGGPGDYR